MESVDNARYEIRRAAMADVPELIRMQMALQRDMDRTRDNLLRPNRTNVANLREYYCARIRDEQTEMLIALAAESSRAVGMGAGKIWLHGDYLPPRSGELIDLWVDPEYRKRNVARRIVAQLLRFFRTNAVDFLVVSYVEGNLLGENLWKRLRFEPVLITATADRKDVEGMLGIPGRHAAPMAYRSSLAGSSKAPMFSTPAV
ncbi:MAG: GNAT family N-acetyltransferase [Phycisphaerales bacterium]